MMKRKLSRTQSGRPKRLISKRLPLERIPVGEETHCALLRVNAQVPDLQELVDKYSRFGLLPGVIDEGGVLEFANMGEVEVVESQLREVVDRWLERESSWEVEYSLRSGVKGKSRA